MRSPLRVLFVEDSEDDVALLIRELRRAGYEPVARQVQTPEAYALALAKEDWHIILSDYTMPRFSGLHALQLLQKTGRDIPFILLSGTVGEDLAVESMKAGTHDYVMKHNLVRLGPAVARELREAESRRQRRQAEQALRDSQTLLALIYNHTSEMLALFTVNEAGVCRLASANAALRAFAAVPGAEPLGEADLLGHSPALFAWQVLQRGVQGERAQEVVQLLEERFEEVVRTGQTASFEIQLQRPEGPVDTEQRVAAVIDHDRGGRHILWACRDISERSRTERQQRQLEAQLQQAQKMEALGTLAGGIAHDFNNVLTGITGHLDLLLTEPSASPAVLQDAAQVMRGVERATHLVRRILNFSRKNTPDPRPVQLHQVVQEALQLLRPVIPSHITIRTHLPGPTERIPAVLADANQIHQVIVNLCTNAIHALADLPGTIEIRVDTIHLSDEGIEALKLPREGPYVRLIVADDGPGIAPEALPHIFEPFFTTKAVGLGTGLGLSVVEGIVRAHQGALRVQSRTYPEEKTGAIFEIFFPIRGPI